MTNNEIEVMVDAYSMTMFFLKERAYDLMESGADEESFMDDRQYFGYYQKVKTVGFLMRKLGLNAEREQEIKETTENYEKHCK